MVQISDFVTVNFDDLNDHLQEQQENMAEKVQRMTELLQEIDDLRDEVNEIHAEVTTLWEAANEVDSSDLSGFRDCDNTMDAIDNLHTESQDMV